MGGYACTLEKECVCVCITFLRMSSISACIKKVGSQGLACTYMKLRKIDVMLFDFF